MSQEQPIKNLQDCCQEHVETSIKSPSNELVLQRNVLATNLVRTEPIALQVVKDESIHYQSSTTAAGGGPLGLQLEQLRGDITIGEALEATALTAGQSPVDYSDAAAIQAAEVRATGRTNIVPGGVAAAAQSAATRNARVPRDEDKTKLVEILSDASAKLKPDKAVTRRDAEGVIGAELRNDPNICTRPGGVSASLAAAARLNQTNALSINANKININANKINK